MRNKPHDISTNNGILYYRDKSLQLLSFHFFSSWSLEVCPYLSTLLLQDLQEYVDNHDYLGARKKEILHKNWSERVYEPMRKAIITQIDGDNYNQYKTRKDQLYREYIEHVNKKVGADQGRSGHYLMLIPSALCN